MCIAFVLLIGVTMVIWSPVPMNIAFASRSAAFKAARERVAAGAMPTGPFSIAPFHFTDSEKYDDEGIIILYSDGTKDSFPASGDGFIYLPPGAKFPPYNQGSDGHLSGRWYWFVTD